MVKVESRATIFKLSHFKVSTNYRKAQHSLQQNINRTMVEIKKFEKNCNQLLIIVSQNNSELI